MPKPGVPEVLGQCNEFCELEWLDEISIGPTLKGNFFLVGEFGAGQYHDRQAIKPGLLPNPAEQGDGVVGR